MTIAPRPLETPAARVVLAWVAWYTRGLEPRIAEGRRDELASDVWEQLQDPGHRASASLLGRALRGAPADLVWRRRTLRQAPDRPPLHLRWERSGLLAVVVLEALVLLALLGGALAKAVVGGNAGSLGPARPLVLSGLAGGVLLAVAGLGAAASRAVRWGAPLLLLGATAVLLRVAVPAMVQVSTTLSSIWFEVPWYGSSVGWSAVLLGVLVVSAVFHLAVAAAWAPSPRRAGR